VVVLVVHLHLQLHQVKALSLQAHLIKSCELAQLHKVDSDLAPATTTNKQAIIVGRRELLNRKLNRR
jgi:hypothetical protein